ncbi:MAG: ABC1 kinase family protein [Bradymonadia bacterium]
MSKDWETLAGGQGQKPTTGRLGRAIKLGGLATRVTGSLIAGGIKGKILGKERGAAAQADVFMKNADRIVETMGQLKGAAMKIGQMLSIDTDGLPPEFVDRLSALQKSAPPMDWDTLRGQVEGALDRPIEDAFQFFDPEPIGSASIGQVHKARLFDGTDVAVKIQYPGIAQTLESDLKNLSTLLNLGRVFASRERLEGFLEEARQSLLEEANYTLEAENLVKYGPLLSSLPGIRTPKAFPELTAPTVLTMEFIEGQKIDDGLMAMTDVEAQQQILERFIHAFVWMFHDHQIIHADPHPGNFLLTEDGDIALLDFGCISTFSETFSDGMLHLLKAYWDRDGQATRDHYRRLGFGPEDGTLPSAEMLVEYHDLILTPMGHRGPFNFGDWAVNAQIRKFMRTHLEFLKMVPPPESLMYFRVVAGIKGLLNRVAVPVDVHAQAVAAAVRRGIVPEGAYR